MIEQKIPLFYSGNILKYEMLENLRDYALDYSILQYSGYADGIIRGCEVTTTDDVITIHKGMILSDGMPLYITDTVQVRYSPTNTVKCLVVRIGDITEDRIYRKRQLGFELINIEDKVTRDIEICRFRLQNGAKLRYEYRDLEDMTTVFDTVCPIYANWAAFGESTVAYSVLSRFAKDAEKAGVKNAEDRMFLNQIYALNGESLPINCIRSYLTGKLGKTCMQYRTEDIHAGLVEALKEIKGGRFSSMNRNMRERRILVD